jgi:Cu(I)/Ag(I) efflux system membrane fusion protein
MAAAMAWMLIVCAGCSSHDGDQRAAVDAQPKPLYYRHPMNPAVTSPVPARDEMGMEYVPVYDEAAQAPGELHLSAALIQKLGVRTAPVSVGPLNLEVRAPGIVRYDERSLAEAYAPTGGRVEKLSVRAVGERVSSGQLLFEIYSSPLASADAQYLAAVNPARSDSENPFVGALRALGLTDQLIADLREGHRAVGRIPVRAGSAGVITALNCRTGAVIGAGAPVLRWASVDPIWVIADVPASQASVVKAGATARIRAGGPAGTERTGHVDYIYPEVDAATRSTQVRVVLSNADGLLRPNMFVSTVLYSADGAAVLHVPREAVIRDGDSARVIVALGEGRFAPRRVELGPESGEQTVVRSGLEASDHVVTSGIFLLDSESALRAGLARMNDPDAAATSTSRAAQR